MLMGDVDGLWHPAAPDAQGRTVADYCGSYRRKTREEAAAHLQSLYERVPADLLRQHLRSVCSPSTPGLTTAQSQATRGWCMCAWEGGCQQLTASPEAFVLLRARFARSLATMNTVMYLLGTGPAPLRPLPRRAPSVAHTERERESVCVCVVCVCVCVGVFVGVRHGAR
jgi:hypothetical protein